MPETTLKNMIENENLNSEPQAEEMQQPTDPQPKSINLGFLQTKTGSGDIADYIDHPMNFRHNEGMAQILRGLTGLFDDLDLAIIDIFVGAYRLISGKKAAAHA